MTDPQPLLSPTAAPEKEPPTLECHRTPSLDDMIEHCIGDLGWKHTLQATLVSFTWFFDAQQTFISVFTDAEPEWSCTTTTCAAGADLCHLPSSAWAWDTPPDASIISDWSLQCAGSIVKGLPASSFFFGCLIGGFALATLADSSLGRKKMLVYSSLLMSLTGVLTALSTGVWMYTALRFVSGFGRATIGTCALVLSTELVGKKWRENIGIVGFICFTLGFLSLPIIAFFCRDCSWRLMYLWTCVPSVIYSISLIFLVPESPRWLFIKGKKEEFAETLRSMAAPTNRSSLTQSFFGQCNDERTMDENDIFSAAKILLSKGWSCRRLVSMMVVGFGIGIIYYGMPLGLGNLSVNLYISVTLNALSEFPASLFTFLFIGKLNRKGAVLGLCVMSGICSVCCVMVSWQGMQIVLELLSFFCACTAFDIVLIYTIELFPTSVRNSAVSMVRQALVFGGALSPLLVSAGRNNAFLSYGVFGVAIAVCALFVVCLPETRGRLLCDTMEEEERRCDAVNSDGVYCI
ncbi:organic cation/carnitine transporter 3-like [Salvia divinorum]|uniref:Organic cation/carnitine transporter 3-like n=1 Tax=Salvia divinorum TaxID=28513 RepID=A0ABD1FZ83_SALDI